MAHKTKVNGTNYEISGGKTLVNGTAYEIKGGKTLVDGVIRDVRVVNTITLSGTGKQSGCYITHNGTKYYDATQTPSFEANNGDTIYCYVDEGYEESRIYLNGTRVAEGKQDDAEYYYTVVSNATIEFSATTNYKRIYITET